MGFTTSKDSQNASVTIYFIFAIVLIMSIVFSVTEMARMQGQKLYLQIATDTSLDSMASLYYRKLFEYYNMYGVEYKTREGLVDEYYDFIEPYFTDAGTDQFINNWYIAELTKDNVELNYKLLIDGDNVEKEILKYMKFNIVGRGIDFLGKKFFIDKEDALEDLKETLTNVQEEDNSTTIYAEMEQRYFDFTDITQELEKAADDITKYLKDANNSFDRCAKMSASGESSGRANAKMKTGFAKDDIEALDESFDRYFETLSRYREQVLTKKANYEQDKLSGQYQITDDVDEFMEKEFAMYESFVDENSNLHRVAEERRNEAHTYRPKVTNIEAEITSLSNRIETLEEEYNALNHEDKDLRDKDAIREKFEELKEAKRELKEYIQNEVKPTFAEMYLSPIDFGTSGKDVTREKNILKSLLDLKNDTLLKLVLDSDVLASLDTNDTNINMYDNTSNTNIISIDKVLLGEYEIEKLNYFNKNKTEEITRSGSTALEVERLIEGKTNDKENIKEVINKLMLLRLAMNVLYVYKNPGFRESIRAKAIEIVGAGIATPFGVVIAESLFLLMITAIATVQSIIDLRRLLNDKKVNLMHTSESWKVSVEGIIELIASKSFDANDNDEDDKGVAFKYKDYLRLFLGLTNQQDIDRRMVGIMEQNLKKANENFSYDKLIYSFNVDNIFKTKHLFTNLILLVSASKVELANEYKIRTSSYIDFVDLKVNGG